MLQVFLAPTLLLAATSSASTTPAAAPKGDADEKGDAATTSIVGEPKPIGARSLPPRDVKRMPGAFGDPFRAIESMPGVVPVFSGVPYFYVRGAPPGNTGFLIDGIRVPLLFHLGAGPSVLAPALIDRVDFHPSTAPASLGRFAGGFVSGTTRAPAHERRFSGSLRQIDGAVFAETPFADGRGDALVAGRYGNATPVLALVGSNVGLSYGDYQARVGYRVGDRDRVSVFAFGASDALTDRLRGFDIFSPSFHRLDLRWDRALPGGGNLRFATTVMSDRTSSTDDGIDLKTSAAMRGVGTRIELSTPLSSWAYLRAGADAWFERYALESVVTHQGLNGEVRRDVDRSSRVDRTMGVRADVVLRLSPSVEIVPGLRIDHYASSFAPVGTGPRLVLNSTPPAENPGAVGVDPRLAARIALSERVRWTSAFAVAHQGPHFSTPVPGGQLLSTDGRLQQSFQTAQGIELDLPERVSASVTGFHSMTLRPRDVVSACSDPADRSLETRQMVPVLRDGCALVAGPPSRAYGFEVLVRRDLSKRVGGMLAYTLARSEARSREGVIPTRHDRTHVLSAILSVDLGRGYRVGGRFAYMTGRPWVVQRAFVEDLAVRTTTERVRLPAFHRVDVRFEKRWVLGEQRSIAFVVEVLNATLRKEPTAYSCNGVGACRITEIGPLTIPSVGVEAEL